MPLTETMNEFEQAFAWQGYFWENTLSHRHPKAVEIVRARNLRAAARNECDPARREALEAEYREALKAI